MTIRNLTEADAALLPYAANGPRLTYNDFKLEHVRQLMKMLDDPQDKLRIIHIAGTSGKTSTAYYMAALLAAGGKRTGMTLSPHVDSVNERVQIDGTPLPEAEFCAELSEFLEIIQNAGIRPSYFVLLYAFAMWVFVRRGVEYAVVETGIGGLLDATNVADRPDKVCVITDVGFDHEYVLGDTLAKIASQKIGIVHKKNEVFMYGQDSEIMHVVREWAARHQAPLHVLDEEAERRVQTQDMAPIAAYQQRNWLLAYAVYRHLQKRDNLKHLTSQVLCRTQTVRIPGRMDMRQLRGKTLVMDGAHNAQKMAACVKSLEQLYPGVKPAVLLSLKEGKEYEELIPLLVPFAARVIVTSFDTTQDSQAISMDADTLAQALRDAGMEAVEAVLDQHEAFEVLLASPEPVCLVTGSFYLLSQMRNNEHI